jgi:endonuclease/exonuclease/phosphatase family metal-dependent hydrolase
MSRRQHLQKAANTSSLPPQVEERMTRQQPKTSLVHRSKKITIILAGITILLVLITSSIFIFKNPSPPPTLYKKNSYPKQGTTSFTTPPSSSNKKRQKVEKVSSRAISLESLTIVSMNIAGCVPSKEAPNHWNREIAMDAIRTEVLRTSPDILALQECPGGVSWAQQLFGEADYQVLGATYAHADQVVLLVRNGISARLVPLHKNNGDLPAVMAELQWKGRRLLVASVHLAPFEGAARRRRKQVEELLRQAGGSIPLVFAGDTNMRLAEDETMEEEMGLLDVWKLAGSDAQTKFTWDTKDHTAEETGGSFNRYYGKSTRENNARYDRIYCTKSMPVEVPPSFELIANQPLTSKYHFLSDHFGMSAVLKLLWVDDGMNT